MDVIKDTQRKSWEDLKDQLGNRQLSVYRTINRVRKGMTSIEVAERMGVPINWIVGRITELAQKGFIEDSGERVINPLSGKKVIKWRVKGKKNEINDKK